MYMLTNYGGSGLQVVTPDPPDAGGAAINANFKALATMIASADPDAGDDTTAGFGVGSRWYNSASTVEWICLDATPGAAEWAAITSGSLAGYLPLSGGTMTGPLTIGDGNTLYLDAGAYIQSFGNGYMVIQTDTGDGRTLNLNGVVIGYGNAISGIGNLTDIGARTIYDYSGNSFGSGSSTFSGNATSAGSVNGTATSNLNGNDLNMNDGSGSGGMTLNLDGGTFNLNSTAKFTMGTDGNTEPVISLTACGISLNGNDLNMGNAGGSGGGTIQMDGGTISNSGQISLAAGSSILFPDATTQSTAYSGTPGLASVLAAGSSTAGQGIDFLGMGTGGGITNIASITWNDSSGGTSQPVNCPSANTLNLNGNTVSMSDASGSGGTILNLDGAAVYGSAASSGQTGGTWNLGDGSGSHGGTMNLEGGTLNFDSSSSTHSDGFGNLSINAVSVALTGSMGFFGASPVSQQSSSVNTSTPNPGSSTPVLVDTTFDGSVGMIAYTIGDIVAALKKYGLLVN